MVKFIYFNNFIITVDELLNYDLACSNANTEKTLDEKCKSIITIYWLIVVANGLNAPLNTSTFALSLDLIFFCSSKTLTL